MKRYCEYVASCGLRIGKKIYLSKRLNTEEFVGYWQWAGGEVEKNENPRNAAQREVKEETGLELDIARFLYLGSIINNPTVKCCYVYFVDLNETEYPVRTENKSSDWVALSYDDALKLHLLPGLAEMIQKIRVIK